MPVNDMIQGALKEAADLLSTLGEEAAQDVQDTLKSISRTIVALGTMLAKGEIARDEAELAIGNLIRAAESEGLATLIEKERQLIRRGVAIATKLLSGLAALL